MNRFALYAVAALVLLLAAIFAFRGAFLPPGGFVHLTLETPQPAPDVGFADDAGNMHRLSQFRGRFILLNLWAVWCAPCAREMPSLAHLAKALPRESFVVLAVALPPGSKSEIRDFLAQHDGAGLGAYSDSQTDFSRAFRAYALPVSILIDRHGREIARAIGPEQWDSPAAVSYIKSLAGKS